MRLLPILWVIALAGCNSPGVAVWGGTTSDQTVGEFRFTVHHTTQQAEAYRRTPGWRLSTDEVFLAAATAMQQASGCHVDRSSLRGDVARVTADLVC